ncbi:MAG TPA: FhaA domain-containing protein, partial [Acidimicrobiales bacterium]|nr:FhaA domain-containing protein [Acidimicrobiales bacterium]
MPFRGPLQPIEISHRMLREMDLGRRVGVRGLLAPNHFAVSISGEDLDRFEGFTDALVHELAESARQHAANEGYAFSGPVEVELFESKRLKAGRVDIVASFFEGEVRPTLVGPDGTGVSVSHAPIVIGRLPECSIVLNDTNVS